MPRDFEDDFNEDNSCFECGEIDYAHSKTPGICLNCWNDLHTMGLYDPYDIDDLYDDFGID